MSSEPGVVVILSTADFDSDVWTNKQHLAAGLANEDTPVIYVNSLGLRRPSVAASDLRRIARRLTSKRKSSKLKPVPPNVTVIRPSVLPFHALGVVRTINRLLIWLSVRRKLPRGRTSVLWTFSPLTYGLEKDCIGVVYHSVDLLHTIDGVPGKILLQSEKTLLGKASRVIASSTGVKQHLQEQGCASVLLWENVAQTELFSNGGEARLARAIFAGNLTPSKVNADLLLGIVQGGMALAIAGPLQIDGTKSDDSLRQVLRHPLVTYLGNLDLAELAVEVQRSMVGLIPYWNNDYTKGVFPMKVFEYLSAGLVVVSTDLESLRNRKILGLRISSEAQFQQEVADAISDFDESEALSRSQAALSNSWTERVRKAQSLLAQVGGRPDASAGSGNDGDNN